MTVDTRGYTMMGVSPEEAARVLLAAGADAIGGNCGNGPDELLPVIAKMRAVAPDAVLVAKSNAGMPELVDLRAVYRADPPMMADAGLGFHEAGARIIGACCGSTPAHLAAMAEALRIAVPSCSRLRPDPRRGPGPECAAPSRLPAMRARFWWHSGTNAGPEMTGEGEVESMRGAVTR
jgi:hypothetical protein